MALSCECSYSGWWEWYWETPAEDEYFKPLATKRSRYCASCKEKIVVGEDCTKIQRWRPPKDEPPYIEERIYGDEVPLAPWYLCEKCSGLSLALNELGFCYTLGDESLKQQIAEYNQAASVQTIK